MNLGQDDIALRPDNDDDRDFLVDVVPIPASGTVIGIILDTTTTRTVCDPTTNKLSLQSYSGDGEMQRDDFSVVRLAIEYDAYIYAEVND